MAELWPFYAMYNVKKWQPGLGILQIGLFLFGSSFIGYVLSPMASYHSYRNVMVGNMYRNKLFIQMKIFHVK